MNDNYIKRQQNRLERSFSSGKKYKSNKEDNSEKKEIERNEDKQADKKEEKEVKKKEDGLIKFCRFLEQMSCKVNYSTVLGKKVMFLIWKCIAIKLHK